jgi:hypothetical protein
MIANLRDVARLDVRFSNGKRPHGKRVDLLAARFEAARQPQA